MRFLLSLILIGIGSVSSYSQKIDTLIFKYNPPDTIRYWKFKGNIGVNFQLVGFRDWAKGGKPSLSLASNLNMTAKYQKENDLWENMLDMGFGIIREGGEQGDKEFRKNDDFLIFISKYGRNLVKTWYLTGMVDFRTQFSKGYATKRNAEDTYPLVSRFMSPATLTPSFGVSYKRENFSFTLAPISGKITFVLDDSLTRVPSNGVDPGQNVNSRAGTTITANDELSVMDNIFVRYHINFFTPFNNYRLKHTDINGEFYMRFKVNKYISSNFNLRLIYDDDYDPKDNGSYPIQLNYVLNVGLTYDIWQR